METYAGTIVQARPLVPRDCHGPDGPGNDTVGGRHFRLCHCEAPKGPWQSLGSIVQLKFLVYWCQEIATSACGLLAMTEEIGAQAQTIDHICHCEASKKPWQSLGSLVQLKFPVRRCPEIATSACGFLAMTGLGGRISGLALSLCPALRLCKGKCLPSRCGRLTPPQAALPCGPRRLRLLAMTRLGGRLPRRMASSQRLGFVRISPETGGAG